MLMHGANTCLRKSIKTSRRLSALYLCRGSAEVGNLQERKCEKWRRMPRFFRNAKVPTGAEEAN
jgi:hypothetical protein